LRFTAEGKNPARRGAFAVGMTGWALDDNDGGKAGE